MRDIGKNIKDLRIRKNMTQDELAEKLFVTRQTVSNYETGKSRPDIDMLEQIAAVLDADIQQVLYGTQQPVEQKKLRQLIIGVILILLTGALFVVLLPIGQRIKARYYLISINFALYTFLLPLFFLFLGWTLAHVTGMALKKEPLSGRWVNWVRWLLLAVLTFIAFVTLRYLIPRLIGEFQFMMASGPRSAGDYIHIPKWVENLFMTLLFQPIYAWHTPYSCAFTLPFGGLLWLFGFPKSKKN